MKVARAKGHLRGKQPKLSPRQEAHLVELIYSGEYTTSEVGDLFGVARSTVYRALQRSNQRAALGTQAKSTLGTPTRAPARTRPASPAAIAPAVGSDAAEPVAAGTFADYRPRHGASQFPAVKRSSRSRSQRQPRPEPTPRTGG